MTTASSTHNPPKFALGNLIHLKRTLTAEYDTTQIFRIDELREDRGGNFHDGFTTSTVATITNTSTGETHKDLVIVYNSYMCGYCQTWAVLVDGEHTLQ